MKHASLIPRFSLLVTVFLASVAHASPTFEQANSSFASRNYRAAIDQYDALLAQHGCSAPVLFNLGNAFYRDGQFGKAILSFERAQVLAPDDGEIAANLQLARSKAGVPAPMLNSVDRAVRLVSPNTLAWTGSAALMAICLAIGLGRFISRFSYARIVAGLGGITLAAVAIGFAVRWQEFDRGIVVAATAPARIAPAGTAAESFALKSGESVTIARNYGQFALVHASGGRSGWVSDADIGRVFAQGPMDQKHGQM
jgi:tetratricopeptide (TPR) repeat protein